MAPKRRATGLAAFATLLSQPDDRSGDPSSEPSASNAVAPSSASSGSAIASTTVTERPAKRRKTSGLLGPGYEEYDATGTVPFYTKASEVPPHLRKFIALDTSETRLALARHNATIYGVADRIEFVLCDFLEFARSYPGRRKQAPPIDVVFLSPPWGGPDYISSSPSKNDTQELSVHPIFSLKSVLPIPGDELFTLSRTISRNIAYYLPRNVDLAEVAGLVPNETVELEEEWMGDKLKAVTCYYGGLAVGQDHLF
ncbi:hypothetical protein FRB99_002313 [Tulasnella sp. 403]|nr:hypothetical protein FRB99_002313 [Tulasnella sp. 403]